MLRILLVEDSPTDAALIEAALCERDGQLEVKHVEQMGEVEEYLSQAGPVDCILLDLGLPDSMGLATVERANSAAPHVPIIVLTGLDDEAIATDAVRKGAQDYQVKGEIRPRTLVRAIHHAIERKQTEEALLKSEERLRLAQQAAHVGVFEWNIQTGVNTWTTELEALYGLPTGGFVRTQPAWEQLVYAEDRAAAVRLVERSFETCEPVEGQWRVVWPDGSVHWLAGRWQVFKDAAGQPLRMAGVNLDITDRKRAEEQVSRSQRTVSELVERAPFGIYVVDSQFRIAQMNAGSQAGAFRNVRPVIGRDFAEAMRILWPEPVAAGIITAFRHALETGEPYYSPRFVNPRHDVDTVESYEWELHRITLPNGRYGVVCYYFDSTTLREAERALRESEDRLRFALESCQIGAWDIDLVDHTAYRSLEHDRIFGYKELLPQWTLDDFLRHALPEYRAEVQTMVRDATAARTGWTYECRIRRADGEVRWIWFSGQHRMDSSGRSRVAGVVQDITERKHVEEAMRESEKRLAADVEAMTRLQKLSTVFLSGGSLEPVLTEIVDAAIAISDADFGNIQLLDAKTSRLRIAAQRGFPKWWLDFWGSVPEGQGVCGTAIERGERVIVEDIQQSPIFVGSDALEIQIEAGVRAVQSTPLVSRSGRPLGMFSTHYKTPHRPDDRTLRLLDLLARQTADIIERAQAEEALRQAKAAAEAANEAKGQFLANMSHELRTPMNAILGMIDVALPKATDPTVQDCLQTAKGSADLLLTLLNDLLDSAKIESGKLELESAAFSLRRMLDQLTRVLAVRASEKGLSFYCRMPDQTPDAVIGDRMRLQQVLLNLAGNAIKFTERGDVEIGLRVRDLPSPFGRGAGGEGEIGVASAVAGSPHPDPLPEGAGTVVLEFAVRDTGIGIPLSGMARLFQPFGQADASMSRRFGGTGLGLSICKNLVEMMGGRIWAESEVGKGSTFYFTVRLPLATEVPPDFDAPGPVPAAACAQLRILLVEDNPANQKLATYILQDRGHVVEIAGDGQEAICLTEQNRYDVILMDVQMPGMNGLEATAAIRRREDGGSRVPIIAMTAHAMRGDRDRCLAAGMDGYLSKPVNAQEMIGLVESLASGVAPVGHFAAAAPGSAEASPLATGILFDPEEALARCFDSQDMVREMIQCFYDEMGNLLPQIRAALEKGDLVEVGRLGHRMKGTVVYLGAQPAKEAALRVERFCKRSGGTPSEAEEAVNALEHECIALKAALIGHPLATEPTRGPVQ